MEWTRGPVIGRGSTATVSLATSVFSGELFALKSTELSKSMFLQKEQSFLSKINSPHIVKYIGYDITNENTQSLYNICLEYVPGGTLHDVILRHGGQLDEPMIGSYTRNILQGLDYLHRNIGLVHCDIKSKNVLISKDGAKIADFGCAKFVEQVARNGGGDASAFSGTPAFMSPEVARGEEQGFPADIWAVGCTVIEMATGSIPWAEIMKNDDPLSVLYRIGFSSEVPEFPSWLSEKGKDFLSKCLRRDSKERWTAKELLDHPFLGELELELKDVDYQSSPSCVLDQDFWNSMDAFESPQDLTPERFSSLNNSPAERINRLIGSNSLLVADVPNWSLEEDWITVRSNEFEENDVILVNTASVPNEFLISDSILYEQQPESSIFIEDLLLEFFLENENISSDNDVSTSEGYNPVSEENLNFETDNEKSCLILILFCFSVFLLLSWQIFSITWQANCHIDFLVKQIRQAYTVPLLYIYCSRFL